MKKRLLSLALCGALLCGALAGCGGNETPATSQEPSSGQTEEESKILTTAVSAELNTLYPLNMDVQNNIGTKLCYEGLVNYENGEVVPCLAESSGGFPWCAPCRSGPSTSFWMKCSAASI